jgi:acid phosphatase (class A)
MADTFLTRRAALGAAAALAATPVLGAKGQMMVPAGGNMAHPAGDNMAFGDPDGGTGAFIPMGPLQENGGPNFRPLPVRRFPRAYWAPELYAQTILAEFGASDWVAAVKIDPPNDATTPDEVKELLRKADNLRAIRMPEIMAQLTNPLPYWADLLSMTPSSGPMTWALIDTAVAVGQMTGMYYKRQFNRARPAEVFPPLMPPAPTPHHPSYPNAHALQGHLIARCLSNVAPALLPMLEALASRVAENREVAGFHFPSDTAASEALAPQLYAKLQQGPMFNALVKEAQAEWG